MTRQTADNKDLFSIADLASEFGISTRAIRFYESKGLLSPERLGATRIFRKRDRAQQVNLLAGKVDERLALLERQRDDLETTIRELREIKQLAEDRLHKKAG